MSIEEIYFKDNFFSSGETEIYDQNKEITGYIDLESMFTSSLTIYNHEKTPLLRGSFKFLSNKWLITTLEENQEIGVVRHRFAFFEKRFEYEAYQRGIFEITSQPFSREYSIKDEKGEEIAHFEKVNNFFESAAFKLTNYSTKITLLELIAVVMGINEIQKRQRNNAK